jgi:hypothetical protein
MFKGMLTNINLLKIKTMENQEQNQQSGDLEQTEQGQGSSGMEQQGGGTEDTEVNQNDIAGNAGGNEQRTPGGGGSDTSDEDAQWQDESLPSDGTGSQEEGDDGEDLDDIETDDDDDLSTL